MASPALTCLSLCSGVGGLELGISLAVPGLRVLGHVGRDAYAASVLLARMEDEALEPAPVFCGDLADFDARPFEGVGLLCAGLPCQPYSVAGKREGHEDERAIWPEFVRIVSECRPALVFLENVPPFLGHFRPVGERLCALGYECEEPLLLAAEDVGASHRRERVFILAHRPEFRRGEGRAESSGGARGPDAPERGESLAHAGRGSSDPGQPERVSGGGDAAVPGKEGEELAHAANLGHKRPGGTRDGRPGPADGGGEVADAHVSEGRREDAERKPEQGGLTAGTGSEVEHPQRDGLQELIEAGAEAGATLGANPPFPPPALEDDDAWAYAYPRWPWCAPATQPGLRVLADGLAVVVGESRADQLRCVGNGVVPLQAALAFTLLARRAGKEIG